MEWTAQTNTVYSLESASAILPGTPWHDQVNLFATGSTAGVRQIAGSDQAYYRVAASTGRVTAGKSLITYVASSNSGLVAVKVLTPILPRYTVEGAGIVMLVSGFVGGNNSFSTSTDFTRAGLIHVTAMYPGCTDVVGTASGGTYDYGGTNCTEALRAVAKFASGVKPDFNGNYLHELIETKPMYNNFGLYAASHPGLAAANLMFFFGSELTNLAWYAGWENPTMDALVSWDAGNIHNPYPVKTNRSYRFPSSYSETNILVSYNLVKWATDFTETATPYFDLNTNDAPDPSDYILNPEGSSLFGKRYYSRAVLQAISNSGAFAPGTWPSNLATVSEARNIWSYRCAPARYPGLSNSVPSLHVMLIFAANDHMQPAVDKPHIHQAFDGFHYTAGCWTRLNPDREYAVWAGGPGALTAPDNFANDEPADWRTITNWAYTGSELMPAQAALAGVAEMADRTFCSNWTFNLTSNLVAYPSP
jgi:hypothetical protein